MIYFGSKEKCTSVILICLKQIYFIFYDYYPYFLRVPLQLTLYHNFYITLTLVYLHKLQGKGGECICKMWNRLILGCIGLPVVAYCLLGYITGIIISNKLPHAG